MTTKVDEEHNKVTAIQRRVREMQQNLDEVSEELEAEKQARNKSEKLRADLNRELDELTERLEEAVAGTVSHIDLNKKQEAELIKLRKSLGEAYMQHESSSAQLRKKHQEALNDMAEQIEKLQRAKFKYVFFYFKFSNYIIKLIFI